MSFRWDGTDVKRHLVVRGRQGVPGGMTNPRPNAWEHLPRRVYPWRKAPDPTTLDPPAETGLPEPAGLAVLSPEGDRAFVQFGLDIFVVDLAEVGAQPPTIVLTNLGASPVPVRKLTDVGGEFPSWAPDGSALHWALGNVFFTYDLERVEAEEAEAEATAHARALIRAPRNGRFGHARRQARRGRQHSRRGRGGAERAGGRDHPAGRRLGAGRGRFAARAGRLDPRGRGGGGRQGEGGARRRQGGPGRHDRRVRGARAQDRGHAAPGHPARHGGASGRAHHHDGRDAGRHHRRAPCDRQRGGRSSPTTASSRSGWPTRWRSRTARS